MAHDVLISYSSKDKKIADAICNRFEANKIKVWMAPRDIIPGKSYAAEISRAIKNTKFVVLLFNNNSFSSQWVRKEIERAVGNGKLILPFLLEKIELDDEWDLYISSAHWLDAMNDDIEKSINNLLASVAKILEINKEEQIISEHEEDTNIITKEILDFKIYFLPLSHYAAVNNIIRNTNSSSCGTFYHQGCIFYVMHFYKASAILFTKSNENYKYRYSCTY